VTLSLLREITEQVRPPRSLWVPFPLGHPLGRPGEPELQRSIVEAALELAATASTPGEVREFTPRAPPPAASATIGRSS
jgi:hypothetical protein